MRWGSLFSHVFTVINFPLSLPFRYLEQQRNPWWRDIFGYHLVSVWLLNDEIGTLVAFLLMVSLQTKGNPRAIKDLLADHSLEKYIDAKMIPGMSSDQGVQYFAISWLVYGGALLFSVYRYVGRGLGDRDAYIIGAVGMILFFFLGVFVRKANRPA